MEQTKDKKNIYKGNRYVPKHDDVWDINKDYESLTVVLWEGSSYTTRKNTPAGVDIKNKEYWALSANFNGQIENYRRETQEAFDLANGANDKVDLLRGDFDGFKVEINQDFTDFQDQMGQSFTDFETQINQDLTTTKTEINQDLATTKTEIANDVNTFKNDIKSTYENIVVNIKDFGAVFNNPTHDNMPHFIEAQTYLKEKYNGGTIAVPAQLGELWVRPLIKMQDNISIIGVGGRPTIKIMDDVKDFYMLFGVEGCQNVKIKNLKIDSNKENRTGYDISESPQILIQLSDARYVDVSDNILIGNGVWVFAVFTGGEADYSRYVKFNHNHVIWKAGLSTDKMGGVYGVEVDNTTVYWDAMDYEMVGNVIETSDGLKNMTCIEMHGANAVLRDNKVVGFRTGLIVWGLVVDKPSIDNILDNNLIITNNRFIEVEAGITNGATINEQGEFPLKKVLISGNFILLAPDKFDRSSGRGIEIHLRTQNNTLYGSDIIVVDNVIDSLPNTRVFNDPNTVYNFTGLTINGGRLYNVMIKNNVFKNIGGIGLLIQGGAEKVYLYDSIIEGNLFTDCGKATGIPFDGFQHRSALHVNRNANTEFIRSKIGVNRITDSKETGTYLTRIANGLTVDDDDQDVTTNTKKHWTGAFNGEIKVQLDNANFDYVSVGRKNGKITMLRDEVTIADNVLIDKTYTGSGEQGMYVHLPIKPEDGLTSFVGGAWSMYDVETNTTITGNFQIKSSNTNIAWFENPHLLASQMKQGNRLWFEFTYPTTMLRKYIVE